MDGLRVWRADHYISGSNVCDFITVPTHTVPLGCVATYRQCTTVYCPHFTVATVYRLWLTCCVLELSGEESGRAGGKSSAYAGRTAAAESIKGGGHSSSQQNSTTVQYSSPVGEYKTVDCPR